MIPLCLAAALSLAPPPPAPPADERLEVLAAMTEELARSAGRLRLDGYAPPYYVAYQLRDVVRGEVGGRYGAVFDDAQRRDRNLYVEVRVGDYEFDSSGVDDGAILLGGDGPSWWAPKDAPLDGDAAALRNALWLATDERYKEALAAYFKKRAREVHRQADPDRAPSFSREEAPARHVDPPLPFRLDRDRWRDAVREASAAFRAHPEVFDSAVKVVAERQTRWFVSSEGAAIVTEQALYGLHVRAVARTPDGQLVESGRDFYAREEGGLPDRPGILRAVEATVSELLALRKAPAIDPYTGPAILEAEAAGVLFHETVGHRLEGDRLDDDKEGQTFKGQVGKRVLPPFLTILDDPTLSSHEGVPLNGAYAFDDQGVAARATVLVRDGTLESYLLSRKPVKPFARSNGHGRSQGSRPPSARMANLVVRSSRPVPMAELERLLLAEVRRQGKPYGLVIRDITGGNTNTLSYGYQAFKGTPRLVYRVDARTGTKELVRGVELVGTPLSSVNRILAASDRPRVFNGYCGAESGYVPVSTISPAVLVGEIELQRVARAAERGPILPSPWSGAAAGRPEDRE